jgi:hypothetical protein
VANQPPDNSATNPTNPKQNCDGVHYALLPSLARLS